MDEQGNWKLEDVFQAWTATRVLAQIERFEAKVAFLDV